MRDRVSVQLELAERTGMCPVCGVRPRAYWPDTGAIRVTCGSEKCFLKWVPGGREALKLVEYDGKGVIEHD